MAEECASVAPRSRVLLALAYGAACHLLFLAGISAMIWAMNHGMSRSFGDVGYPWAIATNALLLAQFPLAHSALLTGLGRRFLARLAPEPHGKTLATTSYVIVASVQLLLLFLLWTPSGIVWWQAEGTLRWAIMIVYGVCWLLLLKSCIDGGIQLQSGMLGWFALMRDRRPRFPDLPTEGLFRLVRQPIYVSFALTLWTVPTWTPDQLAIALSYTAYCALAPRLKEQRFANIYGERFEAYRGRVPYWIPFTMPRSRTVLDGTGPARRNDLAIYDDVAADWWSGDVRWVRTLHNMVEGRLRFFDRHIDWSGTTVLDLGCGGGFMAEALAERGARVTGIDPAEKAIEAARVHAAGEGLDIRYDVGVGENLPYADGAFDAVVCVDVLEHVSDLDRVIAETARVLKPGGRFLFDTINDNLLARLVVITAAEDILHLLPKGTHDPDLFIEKGDLMRRLKREGFEVGRITGLGPHGINRRGDLAFGPVPLTSIIYIGTARLKGSGA